MRSTLIMLVSAVVFATSGMARAQAPAAPNLTPGDRSALNTLYLELGGPGIIYSMNYERFVTNAVALRVGAMYMSGEASSGSGSASAALLVVPVTASYILHTGAHGFELGAGVDVVYASAGFSDDATGVSAFGSGSTAAGIGILGYRYAPLDGGFNFRAALTPIIGAGGFFPWFGLAFGYGF